MQRRGLAPGTIRTRLNHVRSILRGAVRDRLIPSDPSAGVSAPRTRRREAAMTIPTEQQVGAIFDAAPPPLRALVALCAFAGLRLAEAVAVQVDDVDFLRRQLHVRRQAQRIPGGSVEIRPPKYGSERTVYIPDGVVAILSEHLAFVESRDGWLYVAGDGLPPRESTLHHRWVRTLEAAGVGRFRMHDLRHFYASGLIADGCDVVTVQRALGHSSPSTTLNTYSHLWPTAAYRTRRAAANLLNQSRQRIELKVNGPSA